MYPTVDNSHAAEAQALFTDHYRNQLVIPALMKSFMVPIQELEGVFWDIINKFLLANNPVGDQLNKLGSIVGCQRLPGQSDADYLLAVRLQIRINRSMGLSEDVIQVATIATGEKPLYVDLDWAGFIVQELDMTINPNVLASELSATRSAGTYGNLIYTTWADGDDLVWGSVYSAATGENGFGSVYDGTVGGLMAAGAAI